ncbi:BrnA antitoxin family protein [Asaia krungthepensis]|uniref:BrnA antitoxin family protein n=1 Tax=Asaia krungthepensis NRIC 0535 TaxID=1307925 RepID=A0ABQ0Q4P5_9PROT|nr:BrnA antitoxin family protein [Asaia krungthepensis]GBQ91298.1 hypothetical protein AA0535_2258 [Asaia krungthepensis NRIC 0535]
MRKLKTLKSVTETQVREMILEDPDAPEATDRQLRRAVPFAEAFPDLAVRAKDGLVRRPIGRPRSEKKKTSVSLRLDPDVLEKFRRTGPGWQTRINEALRKA